MLLDTESGPRDSVGTEQVTGALSFQACSTSPSQHACHLFCGQAYVPASKVDAVCAQPWCVCRRCRRIVRYHLSLSGHCKRREMRAAAGVLNSRMGAHTPAALQHASAGGTCGNPVVWPLNHCIHRRARIPSGTAAMSLDCLSIDIAFPVVSKICVGAAAAAAGLPTVSSHDGIAPRPGRGAEWYHDPRPGLRKQHAAMSARRLAGTAVYWYATTLAVIRATLARSLCMRSRRAAASRAHAYPTRRHRDRWCADIRDTNHQSIMTWIRPGAQLHLDFVGRWAPVWNARAGRQDGVAAVVNLESVAAHRRAS